MDDLVAVTTQDTYVQACGEEIRARLFPRPKRVFDERSGEEVDGPTPYAMPVGFLYRPELQDAQRLIFTPVRSVQQIGIDPAAGVPASEFVPDEAFNEDGTRANDFWVIVTVLGGDSYVLDLSLGRDPSKDLRVMGVDLPLAALLCAIAGRA